MSCKTSKELKDSRKGWWLKRSKCSQKQLRFVDCIYQKLCDCRDREISYFFVLQRGFNSQWQPCQLFFNANINLCKKNKKNKIKKNCVIIIVQ